MSTVIPETRLAQIEFCESHVPVWTGAPATIGLLPAQCTLLSTLTGDARTAYELAVIARNTARSSTQAYHDKVDAMRNQAADMVKAIKAFAATSNNPNVFNLAQIPPPAAPTPNAAPGAPSAISITLNPQGTITLRWESANSSPSTGGFFNISRRLAGQSGFTRIGGAALREFTDDTVPVGIASASYIITPQRGEKIGTAGDAVTVYFGVGSEGVSVSGGTLALAA